MSKISTKIIVPQELESYNQWLVWKYEIKEDGKKTKPPFSIHTGCRCDSTKSNSWCSFDEAAQALESGKYNGLGFAFTENDPFVFLDLDNCRDPKTGEIEDWASGIVQTVNSYTEISPSGNGLHIIVNANVELPGGVGKKVKDKLQVQNQGGYLTMTGDHLTGAPVNIEHRQIEIVQLVEENFMEYEPSSTYKVYSNQYPGKSLLADDEILKKVKQDSLFLGNWEGNYPSQSEADLALCSKLAGLTDGDKSQIDRLFKLSGLYREKWERDDYREKTVAKALQNGKSPVGRYDERGWLSSEDLLSYNKEPAWLVEDIWMEENVGWIAGIGKSYKSILSLELAASVASGEPFLGKYKIVKPGPVLLIQEEDPVSRVSKRWKTITASKNLSCSIYSAEDIYSENGLWKGIYYKIRGPFDLIMNPISIPVEFLICNGITFKDENMLGEIESKISEYRPVLIVLDPFNMMSAGFDEFKAGDINIVLNHLKEWRNKYGCAIAFVHHYRKNSSGESFEKLYGSQALYSWSENNLFVKRTDRRVGIVEIERDIKDARALPKISLEIKDIDFEFKYEVNDKADISTTKKVEVLRLNDGVLDIMARYYPNPLSAQEIANTLNSSKRNVLQVQNQLIKSGKATRPGKTKPPVLTKEAIEEHGRDSRMEPLHYFEGSENDD